MDVGNRDEVVRELDRVTRDLRKLQQMGLDPTVQAIVKRTAKLVKLLRKILDSQKGAKQWNT